MRAASLFRALGVAAVFALWASHGLAVGKVEHPHAPAQGWTFNGVKGHFDKRSVQRGFKVYREVCSACHALEYMSFRNLGQRGGPFDIEQCYGAHPSDPERKTTDPVLNKCVKAIAAEYQVPAGPDDTGSTVDEQGNPLKRPGKPSDPIPGPYENPIQAAAANNGKAPPNLSLITEAREGGANYVYSLITGYPKELPEGLTQPDGLHYNPYFPGDVSAGWKGPKEKAPPGGFTAMAPPLVSDGQVAYDDGTEATIEQMAYDVVNFLKWAAEPRMEARKETGLAVGGYLILLALLLYWSYRRVWRDVEH